MMPWGVYLPPRYCRIASLMSCVLLPSYDDRRASTSGVVLNVMARPCSLAFRPEPARAPPQFSDVFLFSSMVLLFLQSTQ